MIRDTSDQDINLARPQRDWHKNPKLWGAAIGLVVLVTLAFPYVNRLQGASLSVSLEKVRLGTVERGDLIRDVTAQGKIIASVKPVLYSPSSGRVSLKVRAGDSVEKGSLIAEIFSPELVSQHEQENSELESLRSEVKRQEIQTRTEQLALQQNLDLAEVTSIAASREKRRADSAFEKGIVSVQDFEKAADDLHRAELELEHLEDARARFTTRRPDDIKCQPHIFLDGPPA